jgi:uncharacterized protein YuzE
MSSKISHTIRVNSATAPTVEVDTEAAAVYVRFKRTKVVRTLARNVPHMHVAVDLDRNGEVVGVEAVGVREVQIARILKMAAVQAPNVDFANARYVPAELVAAWAIARAQSVRAGLAWAGEAPARAAQGAREKLNGAQPPWLQQKTKTPASRCYIVESSNREIVNRV